MIQKITKIREERQEKHMYKKSSNISVSFF
jgi:hypothetical protein